MEEVGEAKMMYVGFRFGDGGECGMYEEGRRLLLIRGGINKSKERGGAFF